MSSSALRSTHLRFVLWPALFLFFIFAFCAAALADSHARIVRLSYIDGDVQIDRADGHGFNTAYLNMPVIQQAKVWARDGQAEVELEDGSSIRLTPNTIVAFTELSLGSEGQRTTSVDLQQGTAYFDLRQRDPDRFILGFGRDQVDLITPAHFRVDASRAQFELAVFKGEVQVSSGGGPEVAVKGGETIRLDQDDPDRYYLAKEIDVENYDEWDRDRTKNHDEVVANGLLNDNNAVTYGSTDLNTYGNFFYVPGYGNMWRPISAPLGWDPFADGYWMFYPGYGYMFVSSYPWGWMPYRYGSWDYISGYGWCWAPGTTYTTWYPVPPLRNRPPHYHPPRPPSSVAPILAVNNGRITPVPTHIPVAGDESFPRRRPLPTKIQTANGTVLPQPGMSAPVQGFVSTTNSAPNPGVGAVVVSPVRPIAPRGPHRLNDGVVSWRNAEGNQNRQIPSATVTTPASAPARTAVVPTPTPMESRGAPQASPRVSAPPMHAASSPAMSSPRMSSPSVSGGGMRMSSPSMGGGGMGGGGGHSSGGGGGGHSGGGHH